MHACLLLFDPFQRMIDCLEEFDSGTFRGIVLTCPNVKLQMDVSAWIQTCIVFGRMGIFVFSANKVDKCCIKYLELLVFTKRSIV